MGENEKLTADEVKKSSRPTLGLIIGDIWDEISQIVWTGINDLAQKRDFNLICINGEAIHSEVGFQTQANVLYQLVSAETVDGLVVWGGGIGQFVSPEVVQTLCESYHPMPVVNAALPLENIPSVLVSNYDGMREAITHLIAYHGCRRVAFVRGPEGHPEAEERFRAYKDVLAEHEIPFDPDLVAPGNFTPQSGSAAIELLVEERGLEPGIGFEAVAVVDDLGAVNAIEALQARNIQVPGQVAVVGFDDARDGWYVTPPLTTVPGLVYQQAQRAANMVLDLLDGKEVAQLVTIPSELIIRQSCGCMDPVITDAAVEPSSSSGLTDRQALKNALTEQRDAVIFALIQTVANPSELRQQWITQLVDALTEELGEGKTGSFLSSLDQVLRQVANTDAGLAEWHRLLSALRRYAIPHLGSKVLLAHGENLWQQARVMLAGAAERAQAYAALQEQRRAATLRAINQTLITANQLDELRDALAQDLHLLEIPSAYLSLYENPAIPTESARLIVAYRGDQRLDSKPAELFPSRQLAPNWMFRGKKRFSMILQALFYRESQIGFMLTEAGPKDAEIVESMRVQISSVLRQTILRQQLERQTLQLRTAAEVSRAASSTLELDQLMQQAVELARDRFDLYYAGLFLLDQNDKWAVLQTGTGEAGQQMVKQNHKLEIGGKSMISACILDKQAHLALDVGAEAVRFENPYLPHTRSELALPLLSRGRALGALTIQSTQESAFTEDDMVTFQTMADLLANAIENASLFERTQTVLSQTEAQAQQMAVLNQMSDELGRAATLSEILDIGAQTVSRIFAADRSSVALFDEENKQFQVMALYGKAGEIPVGTRLPLENTAIGQVFQENHLTITSNIQECDELDLVNLAKQGILTTMSAPLVAGTRPIGTIDVASTEPEAYTFREGDLFLQAASLLSSAIENRRLFEQTQDALQEMEAVQRRYLQQVWTEFAAGEETAHGYALLPEGEGLNTEAWLPTMGTALQQDDIVAAQDPRAGEESSLAIPIRLYGETIGALGFNREGDTPWQEEEINLVQNVIEEVAQALERQRLLDETQTALNEARIFRQFAEASSQGISMANLEGQLVYGNPTFCQLMGIDDPEDALGMSVLSFYSEETRKFIQEQAIPTTIATNNWVGELDVVSAKGRTTPSIQNMFLIRDDEGNPTYLANVVTDITDRRQAEAEIQNTLRELENLNRIMSRERWQAFHQAQTSAQGYLFDQAGVRPATSRDLSELTSQPATPEHPSILTPVTVRGEPIGMIGIQDDPNNPLSDEDRALLEAIAAQVADALESARLFEETQDARADAEVLYEAGTEINAAENYEGVLEALRYNTILAQADRDVSINLFDRPWTGNETPELITVICRWSQLPQEAIPARYPTQTFWSILGRLKADEPTLISGMGKDHRIDDDIRVWYQRELGAESLLYVPLVTGGQWFGFVQGIFGNPAGLSEAETRRLMTLASQAAVAVQSLRQLDEIQAQAGREQALRQVAETIGRSEQVVENLPIIGQFLFDLLSVHKLALATLTPGDLEFDLHPANYGEHGFTAQESVKMPLKGTSFGWSIQRNEALLQTDIRDYVRFSEDEQLVAEGMVSRIVVPLQVGNRVLGSLGLFSQHPGSYTEDHLPVLRQIAGQMGLALERARLLEETQTALQQVEETYRRYLQREWGEFLTATTRSWGYTDSISGLQKSDDYWSPEVEQALDQGAMVAQTADEQEQAAVLALPIKLRGQTIGVLDFIDKDSDRVWSDEDRALVEALADQVALALENARLLEQTERRAHRERLTSELASKIHAAGDTQAILATAADELGRALGVSRTLIRLGGPPDKSPRPEVEAEDSTNGKQMT